MGRVGSGRVGSGRVPKFEPAYNSNAVVVDDTDSAVWSTEWKAKSLGIVLSIFEAEWTKRFAVQNIDSWGSEISVNIDTGKCDIDPALLWTPATCSCG